MAAMRKRGKGFFIYTPELNNKFQFIPHQGGEWIKRTYTEHKGLQKRIENLLSSYNPFYETIIITQQFPLVGVSIVENQSGKKPLNQLLKELNRGLKSMRFKKRGTIDRFGFGAKPEGVQAFNGEELTAVYA